MYPKKQKRPSLFDSNKPKRIQSAQHLGDSMTQKRPKWFDDSMAQKKPKWFDDSMAHKLERNAIYGTNKSQSNCTGLPDDLKIGMENLTGLNLDHVRVHYNSMRPLMIRAKAYTQGHNIYLAKGQEAHLPHELGHVVQQMQGRVPATMLLNGIAANGSAELEREATRLGELALQTYSNTNNRQTNDVMAPTKLNIRQLPHTSNQQAPYIGQSPIQAKLWVDNEEIASNEISTNKYFKNATVGKSNEEINKIIQSLSMFAKSRKHEIRTTNWSQAIDSIESVNKIFEEDKKLDALKQTAKELHSRYKYLDESVALKVIDNLDDRELNTLGYSFLVRLLLDLVVSVIFITDVNTKGIGLILYILPEVLEWIENLFEKIAQCQCEQKQSTTWHELFFGLIQVVVTAPLRSLGVLATYALKYTPHRVLVGSLTCVVRLADSTIDEDLAINAEFQDSNIDVRRSIEIRNQKNEKLLDEGMELFESVMSITLTNGKPIIEQDDFSKVSTNLTNYINKLNLEIRNINQSKSGMLFEKNIFLKVMADFTKVILLVLVAHHAITQDESNAKHAFIGITITALLEKLRLGWRNGFFVGYDKLQKGANLVSQLLEWIAVTSVGFAGSEYAISGYQEQTTLGMGSAQFWGYSIGVASLSGAYLIQNGFYCREKKKLSPITKGQTSSRTTRVLPSKYIEQDKEKPYNTRKQIRDKNMKVFDGLLGWKNHLNYTTNNCLITALCEGPISKTDAIDIRTKLNYATDAIVGDFLDACPRVVAIITEHFRLRNTRFRIYDTVRKEARYFETDIMGQCLFVSENELKLWHGKMVDIEHVGNNHFETINIS